MQRGGSRGDKEVNKYLDSYFNLARATEEKLQHMSDKVEATDIDREKNIKKDMPEMKQR